MESGLISKRIIMKKQSDKKQRGKQRIRGWKIVKVIGFRIT